MKKENISDSIDIPPMVLSRDNFIHLVEIVRKGLPNDHSCEISVEVKQEKLCFESIEEFMQYKDLPDVLIDVEICVWHSDRQNIIHPDKSVTISFGRLGNYLLIDGNDAIWKNGITVQILEFLEPKSEKYFWITRLCKNEILISLVTGIWIIFSVRLILNLGLLLSFIFIVSSTYLMKKYIDWVYWSRPKKTRIIIREKAANRISPELIITILNFLATVITAVIAILDFIQSSY